jgi:hypothetical protein
MNHPRSRNQFNSQPMPSTEIAVMISSAGQNAAFTPPSD